MVSLTRFQAQTAGTDSLSQTKADSVNNAKALRKSTYSIPRRVTLMSAVLPGLGQGYNKHYWKIPVIYAGLGGFAYLFVTNNREYNYYRTNLRAIYDDDPATVNSTGYSEENVQLQKVTYRRRRDLAGVGIAAVYVLNLIDANVSAHLKTFDVSDDLSLQLRPLGGLWPTADGISWGTGLCLKISFK